MGKSFLQSQVWGEVQQTYGREIRWVDNVLAIRHKWYWFIPQGPYVDGLDDDAIFVRYEPVQLPTHDHKVSDIHPSSTLLTPLGPVNDMLANMKQKCRYNIHLAEKKQLNVIDDLPTEIFFHTLIKTSIRQHIILHPQHYYQTIVDTLKKYDMVRLYGVQYQGQILAVAMVVYHDGTATYVHGGSNYEYRSLMAPYLLHWKIMNDAYQQKENFYDWFGLSNKWPGVTRFKLGFGGQVVERPGTFEHVLRPLWYTGYRMMKRLWIS